jgi:hypothetical protein
MLRLRPLFLAPLAFLSLHAACSTPVGDDTADVVSCDGARRDENGTCRLPNGRFAKDSCCELEVEPLACDVVSVGYSELEEGFGSYYDIDADGYSNADEDAEDISIDIDDPQPSASLGHHSFTAEDGDRVTFRAASEDAPWRSWKIETSNDETYTIRVFANDLGVIHDGEDRMGTLDCRGVLDTEPEIADVAKMDRCNNVWVDEGINANLWEEGLGSIYDIDDEGYSTTDGDSVQTFIDLTPGEAYIRIGQASFSEADGDSIEVVETDEHVTYVVRPAEDDDFYSVRIFRAANDAEIPGIGTVLFHDAGDPEGQQLVVLDCRGLDVPGDL